jgi:hypothetical protein
MALNRAVREYLRKLGSKGGKARQLALTEDQRSKAMTKAVAARWKKTTRAERSAAASKAARARWKKA